MTIITLRETEIDEIDFEIPSEDIRELDRMFELCLDEYSYLKEEN